MHEIVLYAVGSPIVVDFEESLRRAAVSVAAAIRNRDCQVQLLDRNRLVELVDLTEEITAKPFLVPLFTPGNRQRAVAEARGLGFRQAFSLVDPSVALPRAFAAGQGLFINSGCSVGGACELDEFALVNRGANLGHHARLERFVSIGPGATVGSFVQVGRGALVGAGAVVLPRIRIGPNSVVGAGAVVTKDVPGQCQVVGNPARIVKQSITGYGDLKVA